MHFGLRMTGEAGIKLVSHFDRRTQISPLRNYGQRHIAG